MAAFLWTVVVSQPAYAADATWENGAISYEDKTFSGPTTAPDNSPMGLPEGTQYYESTEGGRVSIIYFPPSADVDNAQGARYAEFNHTPPDRYTPRGQAQAISIDPRSEVDNGDGNEGDNGKEATSCAVNGIGYILCPIMGFIADAMDKIYGFLRNFLEVRPLSTEHDSSLYRAWKYMQSFANIAFAIVFLIIVYSQLTNQGVSNYNVKRMIPRLVIAALLVNTSYYICAILVDASNIAGASLQDILMQIRTELIQGQEQNRLDSLSWGEMTAYLLSGGTIVGAGLVGLSGAGTSVIYLLVPVLITALIAVFVAVAILAARQALITILVMISPIAFVAFVLPGTQKYFDRWKDIFQTMLFLYPIFAVLFGGAQLAGYIIAQNADRPEVILLAMFVQLAPLIITPFLIKFSGGLLSKFAGMINNPTRGVGDRAKNWASGKRDLAKAQRMADHSFGSGLARRMDDSRRRDEAMKKRYETRRGRRFNSMALGRNLAVEQMREDDQSKQADMLNDKAYEDMKMNDNSVRVEAVKVKLAEAERDNAKKHTEVFMSELRTRQGGEQYGHNNETMAALSHQLQHHAHREHVLGSRASMAAMADRSELSQAMVNDKGMQAEAAGILGKEGEMLAAANAAVAMRQDFGKGVGAVSEIMEHVRMSGSDVKKLAMKEGDPIEIDGFTFDHTNEHVLEAAVEKLMTEKGNMEQKLELIAKSSDDEYATVRTTISSATAKNVAGAVPFVGGAPLDKIATTGVSKSDYGAMVRQYVKKGKANQSALVGTDEEALKIMVSALEKNTEFTGIEDKDRQIYLDNRQKLFETATSVLNNPRLQESIKENARTHLEKLSSWDANHPTNVNNQLRHP
ncbi:MAG: hypothetical protein ACTJG2_02860 [Candidatus Saccharimonadales bacterium]